MQTMTFLNAKRKTCIRYAFIALFMLYAILGSNSITYGHGIITPIMWLCFALSAVILGYKVIKYKTYFKFPETLILIGTVFSIGLSTLINYRYSFKSNAVLCIYWVIYFFVLFSCEKGKSRSDCKKDFKFVCTVFVIYTTVAVLASLVLYFAGVGKINVTSDTEYTYNLGFVWGRLWGVFINPNNGAISSALSIIVMVCAFIKCKKLWARILIVLDCAAHMLYIVFSDSRSGSVALSVAVAVFVLCIALIKLKDKKLLLKGASVVLSALIGVSCFMCVRYLKAPVNGAIEIIASQTHNDNKEENDKLNIIDRGYDLSDDISNRRFDVWKSGLEVFLNSPKNIIAGLSFRGFTDYARENMPDTYIVNNDYADMTVFDNEAVNILVANGAIGIICIGAFVLYILICMFKRFNSVDSPDKNTVALMFAVLFALACSAMFSSVMFYHFSPNTVIFWLILGNCIAFLNADRESAEQ